MSIQPLHYEALLSEYSSTSGAIALLRQYRPYLEMLPSMRRPDESVITIPLPIIKFRLSSTTPTASVTSSTEACRLPCDVAILMCDPEWKIKTGVELFVFIHRPHEDFSDLLGRWRQTQIYLSKGYEWDMPLRYRHILNEGADATYPLFVVFEDTPSRIKRGLKGAFLPVVVAAVTDAAEERLPTEGEAGVLWTDRRDDTLTND